MGRRHAITPCEGEDSQRRPVSLIKTPETSGIQAQKGGGWKVNSKHATYADEIDTSDAKSLKVGQEKTH